MKDIHDKYRVDKKRKGTYDRVIKGTNILRKNNYKNLNLLSVTNAQIDPKEIFKHFVNLELSADFLLLDSTYDNYDKINSKGDWFITMFDYWYNTTVSHNIKIRIFEIIYKNILLVFIQ